MNVKNKVAIITGSSRGIGLEIAKQLASMGCKVVINSRNPSHANAVAEDIQKEYKVHSIGFGGDISKVEVTDHLVKKTLETFKTVDILVNNAGITRDNLLVRMKVEEWEDVLNTNLKSAFLMTKAVIRQMMRQRWGRIINLSSVVGQMGNSGQSNYCASKGGLIAFTKSLAKEVASKQITVNAIAPGFIQTDMTSNLNESTKEILVQNIPLKRLGTALDVAYGVCYLASEESSYITGQVLGINGGLYM